MSSSFKKFKFNITKDNILNNIQDKALKVEKIIVISICVSLLLLLVGTIPYSLFHNEITDLGFHIKMFYIIIVISFIISVIVMAIDNDDNRISGYYESLARFSQMGITLIACTYLIFYITYYFGYLTTLIF